MYITQWRIQYLAPPIIWPFLPKNCMKMKNFWLGWGVPCAALDPPMQEEFALYTDLSFLLLKCLYFYGICGTCTLYSPGFPLRLNEGS